MGSLRPLLIFLITAYCFPAFADSLDDEIQSLEKFSKVYNLILTQYAIPKQSDELIMNAIRGMVSSLDPYSDILTREELDRIENQSLGQYSGIGITTQNIQNKITVIQVYQDSPAYKAGIRPGDIVKQINNRSISTASPHLPPPTQEERKSKELTIIFYHPEAPDKLIKKTITKSQIKMTSVNSFVVTPNLLVIQIHQFQKKTPDEITKIIEKHQPETIILDLRNNPGGLLIAAVETAELFLASGKIVETKNQHGQVMERYMSGNIKEKFSQKLYVLLNRYSASSAEIFAGAIKDRKRGTLIGEKTFGKGIVQSFFQVSEDLFLKLTIARYYTPSGISIHKIGIPPHIMIKDAIKEAQYKERDIVYQETLKKAGY